MAGVYPGSVLPLHTAGADRWLCLRGVQQPLWLLGSCCPAGRRLYDLATHVSERSRAAHLVLEKHMGKEAVLHADMCLGEREPGPVPSVPGIGHGCSHSYHSMSTVEDIHVEQYEELK